MKKQILVTWVIGLVLFLGLGQVYAQGDPKMKMKMEMNMAEMHKKPQHMVMMAYRHNMIAFSNVLYSMAETGKFEDLEAARSAFAEIKRSMEKIDEIHMAHMGKMTAEMKDMMKPMMEKMQAENAVLKEQIRGLERALSTGVPDAMEVEMRTAALIKRLEKMDMPEMKMKMKM